MEDIIESIMKFASDLSKIAGKLSETSNGTSVATHILIILDDLSHYMRNSAKLEELYSRGRNLNISVVGNAQDYTQLDKKCRQNLTHILLFTYNEDTIEQLLKSSLPITIGSKKLKSMVMQLCNQKSRFTSICLDLYNYESPISYLIPSKEFVAEKDRISILRETYSPLFLFENKTDQLVIRI